MRAKAKKNVWYLDSGCSHHMTRDKAMLSNISPKDGGYVTFGDNGKGKIVGEGKVGKSPNPTIDDVLLVNGLKHNLLSIVNFVTKIAKLCLNLLDVLSMMIMIVLYLLVQGITISMLLICLIQMLSMKNALLVLMMTHGCGIEG